jgi:hypothetical protein
MPGFMAMVHRVKVRTPGCDFVSGEFTDHGALPKEPVLSHSLPLNLALPGLFLLGPKLNSLVAYVNEIEVTECLWSQVQKGIHKLSEINIGVSWVCS